MKNSKEANRTAVNRRAFVSRIGAFGLGAIGATGLLTACGSDNNSSFKSNQLGQLAVDAGPFAARFRDIMNDEANHVAFLVSAITSNGGTPRPEPAFPITNNPAWNPPDITTFVNLADALENTGTGAYLYAAQNMTLRTALGGAVLVDAATIDVVEGRHAGFLNALTNRPLLTDPTSPNDSVPPNDDSRDVPEAPSLVYQRAAPFVTGPNNQQTDLKGGPPLPSDSDILNTTDIFVILNYALFLEYLERDWYARNVPKFFGQ